VDILRVLRHLIAWIETGDERGAALLEYLFLVSLIAVACLLAMQFFGNATAANLSNSSSQVRAAVGG
jgi:Flp pilus assembly pilin Flp